MEGSRILPAESGQISLPYLIRLCHMSYVCTLNIVPDNLINMLELPRLKNNITECPRNR